MIETDMTRVTWSEPERLQNVTVVICQNKTYDLIRLSLTSLLNYYQSIKVLIVNGSPNDRSGKWLHYMAAQHDNVTVWDRTGYDSHGVAMHEAVKLKVLTDYVLMLDSDVIIRRGGFIEMLLGAFAADVFATGALMNVTRSGYAIGPPKDESDVLRYIHPSTAMFDTWKYKSMKTNFADHGAPCVYPMIEAADRGLRVVGLPVANFVMHLSGASWFDPRPVWSDDNNVMLRPLVTFITDKQIQQTDNDFEILHPDRTWSGRVVIHYDNTYNVSNKYFSMRMSVNGDYVCIEEHPPINTVDKVRGIITNNGPMDVISFDGIEVYSRKYFQSKIALNEN